jgi:adenine-specific DNA-methyltransferase
VTAEKLRGGFYTPTPLVDLCLARLAELACGSSLRLLEPSAGDGAFLHGLARSRLRGAVTGVTALEPMEIEAEKARRALAAGGLPGTVLAESALIWAAGTGEEFDAVVGNPPFVRYQFVARRDREAAEALAGRLGIRLAGVSNLWIPVILGALSRLRAGGAFALVVPAECLTGVSAGAVRRWLVREAADVRFDLFPPGSFPGVLQEVTVLSGRRGSRGGPLAVRMGPHRHAVSGDGPWTRYLLAPGAVAALDRAASDPRVVTLGSLVAFEVSIVTGANDFFTVPASVVRAHGLAPWARPLLPRIRHAPGLVYTAADHGATERGGARAWLLDFAADGPDPLVHPGALEYLRAGAARGLPERYKCRIRAPWFRVPGVRSGELLLSKRSHRHPRVVVNGAGVFTTDTIYRGRMLRPDLSPRAIAAGFHNSLTLLSAELEGRSFGGGVLELVPSEVGRLLAFAAPEAPGVLARLDALARAGDSEALVAATDASLVRRGLVEADVMAALADARAQLLARRLDRNQARAVSNWPPLSLETDASRRPASRASAARAASS